MHKPCGEQMGFLPDRHAHEQRAVGLFGLANLHAGEGMRAIARDAQRFAQTNQRRLAAQRGLRALHEGGRGFAALRADAHRGQRLHARGVPDEQLVVRPAQLLRLIRGRAQPQSQCQDGEQQKEQQHLVE